jgi:hypothetical protein
MCLRLPSSSFQKIYYALSAILGWRQFSFATITTVQTVSQSVRDGLSTLFGNWNSSLPQTMGEIQTYRNSIEMPLDPDVEAELYPPPDVSDVGMAIEFRCVI